MTNITNFWIGLIFLILAVTLSVVEIEMVLSSSNHPFSFGLKPY